MKKIFFVCYGTSHARIVSELAVYLNSLETRQYHCEILALTIAPRVLQEYNLSYNTLSHYLLSSVSKQVWETGLSLTHSTDNPDSQDSILYMGVSYSELIQDVGKDKAKEIFHEQGRTCFHPWRTMLQILQCVSPDLIITTNSPRMERAVLTAGKILNIPSICISDGLGDTERYNLCADTLCVYNHFAENIIRKKSHQFKEIVVTGQPVLQRILEKSQKTPLPSKKSVLIAGPNNPQTEKWCREVLTTCREVFSSETPLYFKPHPNIPRESCDILKTLFPEVNFVFDTPLQEILLSVTDFISGLSIASLESVISRRKTFIHTLKNELKPLIVETRTVLWSNTIEALKKNLLSDYSIIEKWEEFVNTENCLENIYKIIKRKCYGTGK